MYELLLALHLIAAVTWVGGSIAMTILSTRFEGEDRFLVARHFDWYGSRVITGAAFVLLAAGIGLVLETPYEFSDLWISLAFLGWLISGGLGLGMLGPLGKKLAAATGEQREALLKRLLTVQYVDTTIIVLVVIDMAVKPGA